MSGITISTLGDLKRSGYVLWASCDATVNSAPCCHSATLDLDQLISQFGEGFEFVTHRQRLDRVLVCSACGQRKASVRLSPGHREGKFVGRTVW